MDDRKQKIQEKRGKRQYNEELKRKKIKRM